MALYLPGATRQGSPTSLLKDPNVALHTISLFTGAGGLDLGLRIAFPATRIVCCVENGIENANLLATRMEEGTLEEAPIWSDIRTFDGRPWRNKVDCLSGGFPCQAFSTAARGRNIAEKNLWPEMLRICGEVCPEFVFAENVAEKAILQAKLDLEAEGYSVKYMQLSAKDVGADHIRERYWLLAHSDNNGKLLSSLNAETFWVQELDNRVWETFSEELRVLDGVAHRMDRLKALGNGQVPVVAAAAFITLMKEHVLDKSSNL